MSASVIRVKTADQERETYSVERTNLYLASFIVNIAVFAMGSTYSWTSPSIPKLRAKNSWLHINTDEASWIGSLVAFGSIFGPFLGGWLVDHIGRRPTVVLSVSLGLMSWAILYQATRVWEIYVSRVVAGIGGGVVFTAVPLYVAEIAEDDVRSALSSLFNFFFTGGLLVEYVVGPYVSYWNLIWVSCAAPVIFLLTSPWLPESPYFHLQQNHDQKALRNLTWLKKGISIEQAAEEIKTIKESIEETKKSKGTFLDLFRTRGSRKALLLSIGCVSFQQLSGINVLLFYSQMIFEMAGQSLLGPSESTILVAVILLIAAAAAIPLTHLFGIKIMLLVSALGMSVFLGLLSLYFLLLAEGNDTSGYSWLPIISLIGYVIVYSVAGSDWNGAALPTAFFRKQNVPHQTTLTHLESILALPMYGAANGAVICFGPLPWAVMAEVFTPNVKGIASAVTSSCCWAMSFILAKLFPILAEIIGTHSLFFSFSVFCVIAFFFILILLPDTRGMSMQEIHELFEESTGTTNSKPTSS